MNVQRIKAPDGSEMVVLSAADYDALLAASERSRDITDAKSALASVAREGTVPGEVVKAMIAGAHPIRAWLDYRGVSQAELARRTGLSVVWISRIIDSGGYGSRETQRKIADALDASVWSLENDE